MGHSARQLRELCHDACCAGVREATATCETSAGATRPYIPTEHGATRVGTAVGHSVASTSSDRRDSGRITGSYEVGPHICGLCEGERRRTLRLSLCAADPQSYHLERVIGERMWGLGWGQGLGHGLSLVCGKDVIKMNREHTPYTLCGLSVANMCHVRHFIVRLYKERHPAYSNPSRRRSLPTSTLPALRGSADSD